MPYSIRATIGTPNKKRPAEQPNKPMVGAGSLVVAMPDGKIREAITVRTYMSASRSASTVYACVWIKPADPQAIEWLTGRGDAGGGGYHKESEAIAQAVSSAGVTLYGSPYPTREPVDMDRSFDFGGTGSSAYLEIFSAIAAAAGYAGMPMEWISHGL